jgi:putative PIN family toxin of toxin-antitoxin system
MIGAVLDANVSISYLLAPDRSTAVQRCVELGLRGEFRLLVPAPLLAELTRKIDEKPYLSARITREELDQLIDILLRIGELIPRFEAPIAPLSRDDKDNYLLAFAQFADADYLVTGDKDLLVLRPRFDRPAIRTPAEFLRAIDIAPSDDDHGSPGSNQTENDVI